MIYNNDIQYNNERTNRTRMFMSHPHDFSKTSMIQSSYPVRSPYDEYLVSVLVDV